MTKLCVCAVFDGAVQAYGRPVFAPAIGAALRSFVDEVNRNVPDNTLAAHPEDFHLTYLADFEEETGLFLEADGGLRVLARGKDVKNHDA